LKRLKKKFKEADDYQKGNGVLWKEVHQM
jgi:hypothetical protein